MNQSSLPSFWEALRIKESIGLSRMSPFFGSERARLFPVNFGDVVLSIWLPGLLPFHQTCYQSWGLVFTPSAHSPNSLCIGNWELRWSVS